MPTEIVITIQDMSLAGYLNDSPAGQALAAALPLEGQAHRWGDALLSLCLWPWNWMKLRQAPVKVGGPLIGLPDRDLCIISALPPRACPERFARPSAVMPVGWLNGDPCCLKGRVYRRHRGRWKSKTPERSPYAVPD